VLATVLLAAVLVGGCAKFNTFYNARKAFDQAERVREDAIKANQDPPAPAGKQKQDYELAIRKAQKVLDEYPGHSLTDDALFLQAKAWHRLEGYRMSIRKLDLLFQNFPATQYEEEALYLQGLNFLLIGAAARSQEFLDTLQRRYPDSDFRAEVLKVSGDNAFALEDWEVAATAYRAYLDQDAKLAEADRIGLKLAECHWELEDYSAAAAVLQEVSQTAASKELAFRARLLQARVQVRIGDFEVVDLLVDDLMTEAEVYGVRAEVRLIEAERLVADGRSDDAVSLLENIPADWLKTAPANAEAIDARAKDMLGYLYLERDDWERATVSFQAAMRRRADLDDPERTRLYADSLRDYQAADQRLVDARPEDRPGLQLLQANALLFGFARPALASDLYRAAAADTMADDLVAARALFGAYLTYRDALDRPDSARIYSEQLTARFPDSPQAYEVAHGREGDLLGYLMARRSEEQAAAYAALSDSAKAELAAGFASDAGSAVAAGRPRDKTMRRRMVYLQRRDFLVFAPTEDELAAAARRLEAQRDQRAQQARRAAADTTGTILPGTGGSGAAAAPPWDDEALPPDDAYGTGGAPPDSPQEADNAADDQETDDGAVDEENGEEEESQDEQQEEERDDHDLW
jgi:outer membrane protein assembly factor BamD (BamD/ComL family)